MFPNPQKNNSPTLSQHLETCAYTARLQTLGGGQQAQPGENHIFGEGLARPAGPCPHTAPLPAGRMTTRAPVSPGANLRRPLQRYLMLLQLFLAFISFHADLDLRPECPVIIKAAAPEQQKMTPE